MITARTILKIPRRGYMFIEKTVASKFKPRRGFIHSNVGPSAKMEYSFSTFPTGFSPLLVFLDLVTRRVDQQPSNYVYLVGDNTNKSGLCIPTRAGGQKQGQNINLRRVY